MSTDLNKEILQFSSLSSTDNFSAHSSNDKPDLRFSPVSKSEGLYSLTSNGASPLTSLLNASREDSAECPHQRTSPGSEQVQSPPDTSSRPVRVVCCIFILYYGRSYSFFTISQSPHLNMRYVNMLNFPKYAHKKSAAFEKRVRCVTTLVLIPLEFQVAYTLF